MYYSHNRLNDNGGGVIMQPVNVVASIISSNTVQHMWPAMRKGTIWDLLFVVCSCIVCIEQCTVHVVQSALFVPIHYDTIMHAHYNTLNCVESKLDTVFMSDFIAYYNLPQMVPFLTAGHIYYSSRYRIWGVSFLQMRAKRVCMIVWPKHNLLLMLISVCTSLLASDWIHSNS